MGPGHDENAGRVVCAWPKSLAMIRLRLRRPKDELCVASLLDFFQFSPSVFFICFNFKTCRDAQFALGVSLMYIELFHWFSLAKSLRTRAPR